MSKILPPLIERLKAVGSDRWEQIATHAGVGKTLPRKLVYGDRLNPRLGTVEPLIDYFDALDRGEVSLPEPVNTKAALTVQVQEA